MPTNYPGAVDTYTLKVDNVTDVLAADVNNLQDAVVALQTRVGTSGVPNVVHMVSAGVAQISSTAPELRFTETDQTLPAGRMRFRLNGGTLTLERNTAAAGDYSTNVIGFQLNNSGNASFGGVISGDGSGLTTLNATNLSAGTVATARLGSGTPSSSTYLRGDQTWAGLPDPPSTAFGGVGSYAVLIRPVNNNLAVGGTEAGSNLRQGWSPNLTTGGSGAAGLHTGGRSRGIDSVYDGGGSAMSGTWRRMDGGGVTFTSFFQSDPKGGGSTTYQWLPSLYVRIS